jgi:AraC-like DNA-binding protein
MFERRSPDHPPPPQRRPEWARWRANEHGVELLEAEFTTHVYERHIHDTYAFGVTLRGVQRFWCRGVTHDSTAGRVIAINPGDAHDGRSGTDGPYAYRMIYIPVDLMRTFMADASERSAGDLYVLRPLLRDPPLARLLQTGWDALSCSPKLTGEDLLWRALARIATVHSDLRFAGDARLNMPALQRVRDYLHARVEDEVRAGELAQVAAMSRFRLTRQFQRAFGVPLHAYHLHLKLEESKRRLRSNLPIARVAADLGFTDQSHFHRRFKGAYGLTPDAWRRAARGV